MSWTDRAIFRFGLFFVLFGLLLGGGFLAYFLFVGQRPTKLDPEAARTLTERLKALPLPRLGQESLPLGVAVFSSYACHACLLHHERHEKGLAEKLNTLGYAYAIVPLNAFAGDERKALIALCTWEKAKDLFPKVHNALYRIPDPQGLPPEVLTCTRDKEVKARLDEIQNLARKAGIIATPTFYLPPLGLLITGVQEDANWNTLLTHLP